MSRRNEMINTLLDYQMLVKNQESRILKLAQSLYFEQDEMADKLLRAFAIENEEIFLKLKRITYDIQGRTDDNAVDSIGEADFFPASLEQIQEGIWKFHLPPFFSVQASKRGYGNAGKHIFFMVMKLQTNYEAKYGKIPKLTEPIVVFEHHICTDKHNVFDFDNIDSKRALDAIQGFFIDDDNILSLIQINIAKKEPKESFCDIYVAEKSNAELQKIIRGRRKKASRKA